MFVCKTRRNDFNFISRTNKLVATQDFFPTYFYLDFTIIHRFYIKLIFTFATDIPNRLLAFAGFITEKFQPISEYFGLVKCSVLPPRALYHPVLPYRTQGKLMFPLCRTCADNLQQEPCHHSDAERTLHGTWVTLELEKALEKGYKLVRIVWHFPEHTDGLFKDYIDTFLRIKQEVRF